MADIDDLNYEKDDESEEEKKMMAVYRFGNIFSKYDILNIFTYADHREKVGTLLHGAC